MFSSCLFNAPPPYKAQSALIGQLAHFVAIGLLQVQEISASALALPGFVRGLSRLAPMYKPCKCQGIVMFWLEYWHGVSGAPYIYKHTRGKKNCKSIICLLWQYLSSISCTTKPIRLWGSVVFRWIWHFKETEGEQLNWVKSLPLQRLYGFSDGCLATGHPHPVGRAGCLLELSDSLDELESTTAPPVDTAERCDQLLLLVESYERFIWLWLVTPMF